MHQDCCKKNKKATTEYVDLLKYCFTPENNNLLHLILSESCLLEISSNMFGGYIIRSRHSSNLWILTVNVLRIEIFFTVLVQIKLPSI